MTHPEALRRGVIHNVLHEIVRRGGVCVEKKNSRAIDSGNSRHEPADTAVRAVSRLERLCKRRYAVIRLRTSVALTTCSCRVTYDAPS